MANRMVCLAVTNTRDRDALRAADLVVDSLAAVSPTTVGQLLRRRQGRSR